MVWWGYLGKNHARATFLSIHACKSQTWICKLQNFVTHIYDLVPVFFQFFLSILDTRICVSLDLFLRRVSSYLQIETYDLKYCHCAGHKKELMHYNVGKSSRSANCYDGDFSCGNINTPIAMVMAVFLSPFLLGKP